MDGDRSLNCKAEAHAHHLHTFSPQVTARLNAEAAQVVQQTSEQSSLLHTSELTALNTQIRDRQSELQDATQAVVEERRKAAAASAEFEAERKKVVKLEAQVR